MIRLLILFFAAFSVSAAQAAGECIDPNFNYEEFANYDELGERGFKVLFQSDSVAPAGYDDYFKLMDEPDNYCHDVMATYIQHESTGKKYVVYTTHDDYCDGGNTIGVIIDLAIYTKNMDNQASMVAEVGDSGVYCVTQ